MQGHYISYVRTKGGLPNDSPATGSNSHGTRYDENRKAAEQDGWMCCDDEKTTPATLSEVQGAEG